MPFPTTKTELDNVMAVMKQGGASKAEQKAVVDEFIKRQSSSIATPEAKIDRPNFFERAQQFKDQSAQAFAEAGVSPGQGTGLAGLKKRQEIATDLNKEMQGIEEKDITAGDIPIIGEAIGAGKELSKFALELSNLGLGTILNPVLEKGGLLEEGQDITDAFEPILETKTPAEARGAFLATLAEYGVPEAKALQLVKAPQYSRLAKLLGFSGKELATIGAVGTGVGTARNEGDLGAGAVEGALNVGGAAVLGAGSKILKQSLKGLLPNVNDEAVSGGLQKLKQKVLEKDISKSTATKQALVDDLTAQLPKIDPAIRRQLSGKTELVKKYIQTAVDANANVNNMSPLALGAQRAVQAMEKIQSAISDTGSEIGKFRQKIANVQVAPEEIQGVINTLDNQLERFGLTIDAERKLVQAPGRIAQTQGNDLKELQAMRDQLVKLKGDPKLQKVVDLRSLIDSNLNFLKDRQDITDKLDPVGKAVRSALAKINTKTIGKAEANRLKEFSELNDLLYNFRKTTGKGRNTEFFVKRILSERDRLPKELAAKIEDITGINLIDDALLSQLTTEAIGTKRLKGLFEQEISEAIQGGVATLITGQGNSAAISMVSKALKTAFPRADDVVETLVRKIADEEDILAGLEEALAKNASSK